jgi:hypothetical protein
MIRSERPDARPPLRSGWCMSNQCFPSELTVGCKHHFSDWTCACDCHDEEPDPADEEND